MNLLFVCVGNSCRSQMAEGIARSMGHSADSAGTHPGKHIASNAVVVLNSRGISTEGMVPKNVNNFSHDDYDMVISMGCGVHCPSMQIDQDWELKDPYEQALSVYQATADEIERRLKALHQ
jgi:arsenate reductase